MAKHTPSLLLFLAYRYIYAADRTRTDLQLEFSLTIERTNALLKKLEFMGFIYRVRTPGRKNGISFRANKIPCGEPCTYTAAPGTMLTY